ncbi:hypothetical protein R3Q06_33055 [Rhodococcus erythropolis]|uniref:hypothetical protein n=1 Tax=Rhodococcus erythropolis TaxID=1833 RepID=UPI00294A835E|nr:hypothetical protein [Rhodococcus erythropolis]MDV6278281.1 hypothetical protein [Rhodococcus erythropolis]
MTITENTSRLHRAGRAMSVFLAGVVVAGGICGGAGISAAATPDAPSTESVDAPQSGADRWSVTNRTGEPVWGNIASQRGSYTSQIGWPKDAPVPSGAGDSAPNSPYGTIGHVYTWGSICYHGAWWSLPREDYYAFDWNVIAADPDRDTLAMENAHNHARILMSKSRGDSGCGSVSGAQPST